MTLDEFRDALSELLVRAGDLDAEDILAELQRRVVAYQDDVNHDGASGAG
jgi:hypothetical protein